MDTVYEHGERNREIEEIQKQKWSLNCKEGGTVNRRSRQKKKIGERHTEPVVEVEMFGLSPDSVVDVASPAHITSNDEPSRRYFRYHHRHYYGTS